MEHEIKIVLKYSDRNARYNHEGKLLNSNIRIYLDDVPIGSIQEINFKANVTDEPVLEIKLPDFKTLDYDPLVYKEKYNSSGYGIPFYQFVRKTIDDLHMGPTQLKLINIDDGVSNVIGLKEVGTDGYIDSFPMKRRHDE